MPRSSQIAGAIAALLVSFGGAWPSARQTKLPSPICASSESVPELLTEGQRLADEWNRHARQCFERAVPIAERSGDRALEAHARLALARAAFYNADYVVAGEQAAGARDLFEALGNRLQVAHASTTMGLVAYPQGKVEVARRHFEAALSTYASIGSGKDRASTLINIAYTLPRGHPDEFRLVTEAVAVARTIEAPILEGRALHLRGDRHFRDGRFDEAISDLNQAIERLRGAAAQGSHTSLANAYVSLGRVYRAHGQPGRAIEHYERAAELQERTGEIRGLMQSTNAKAIVLGILGRFDESRQAYERALSLARQVGIDRLVNIQQGNLAGAHPAADDYQGAIRLLEEVVAREREANTLAYRHGSLASYYAVLKRYDVAIEHAERAIEYGRKAATRDHLAFLWYRRAVVNRALGRVDEALADAQAAVQVVEELRRRLVPLDFMKQGFSEMYQSIFGLTLALVHARGEADNALIVGEQARARAFLDLLASRDGVDPPPATVPADVGPGRESAVEAATVKTPASLLRGAGHSEASGSDRSAEVALTSYASASTASPAEVTAIARRLRTTVLAYWVNDDEVFAWVVRPGQPTRSARIDVARAALEKIVEAAIPAPDRAVGPPLRRLYDLLIKPMASSLPPEGSSLTIVPHGPLFRVSFAALLDEQGRYLIERHAVSYAPSLSTFAHTERLAIRARVRSAGHLVVADPRPLLRTSAGEALAPLPAALREATQVSRALGAATTTILSGERAAEPEVRAGVSDKRVVHFATHGFIRDDAPFESYLALGGSGEATATDGRLTVREIYDLRLRSDIVVLSACRTAAGRPSGDGITGMARALF